MLTDDDRKRLAAQPPPHIAGPAPDLPLPAVGKPAAPAPTPLLWQPGRDDAAIAAHQRETTSRLWREGIERAHAEKTRDQDHGH